MEPLTKSLVTILTQGFQLKNLWRLAIDNYYFKMSLPLCLESKLEGNITEEKFWETLIEEEIKVKDLFSAFKKHYKGHYQEVKAPYKKWKKQLVTLKLRQKFTKDPVLIKKWEEIFQIVPEWNREPAKTWDYFMDFRFKLSDIVKKVEEINPVFASEIINIYLTKEKPESSDNDQVFTRQIREKLTKTPTLRVEWENIFKDGNFSSNLPKKFYYFFRLKPGTYKIWTEFENQMLKVKYLLKAVKAVSPRFAKEIEKMLN